MTQWIGIYFILLVVVGMFLLTDTIRRGFERLARQQKEMNQMMSRIAQQMGYQLEDDALLDEVRVLIQQGKKIKAIQLVRSRKGKGLKEAKEYVDDVENSTK